MTKETIDLIITINKIMLAIVIIKNGKAIKINIMIMTEEDGLAALIAMKRTGTNNKHRQTRDQDSISTIHGTCLNRLIKSIAISRQLTRIQKI